MGIQTWAIGSIMQLPDEAFGRRFVVSCAVQGGDGTAAWDISEIALPEMAVIWEVRVFSQSLGADVASFRMALGDQIPTSTAMMDRLEPLLPNVGLQGADPRAVFTSYAGRFELTRIKQLVATAGRRLVLEVTGAQGKTPYVLLAIVVSGLPREVPKWLISD